MSQRFHEFKTTNGGRVTIDLYRVESYTRDGERTEVIMISKEQWVLQITYHEFDKIIRGT